MSNSKALSERARLLGSSVLITRRRLARPGAGDAMHNATPEAAEQQTAQI